MDRHKLDTVRSSLPYEILLWLNGWYFALYMVLEIVAFLFKVFTLPVSAGVWVSEVVILFCFLLVEAGRLYFGHAGNLRERPQSVFISLLFSIPAAVLVVFFALWQTFVLRLELIINVIEAAFIALETLFALVCIISLYRTPQA